MEEDLDYRVRLEQYRSEYDDASWDQVSKNAKPPTKKPEVLPSIRAFTMMLSVIFMDMCSHPEHRAPVRSKLIPFLNKMMTQLGKEIPLHRDLPEEPVPCLSKEIEVMAEYFSTIAALLYGFGELVESGLWHDWRDIMTEAEREEIEEIRKKALQYPWS